MPFSAPLSPIRFSFQFPVPAERAGIAHLVLFGIESAAVILLIRKLQQSRDEAQQALAAAETARNLAEEANRAKEQFVARVSHEWRAPLNTIAGWLWQLERRAADRDFVARAVSKYAARRRHAEPAGVGSARLLARLTRQAVDGARSSGNRQTREASNRGNVSRRGK